MSEYQDHHEYLIIARCFFVGGSISFRVSPVSPNRRRRSHLCLHVRVPYHTTPEKQAFKPSMGLINLQQTVHLNLNLTFAPGMLRLHPWFVINKNLQIEMSLPH